jgi:hypothetical protein
MGCVLVILLLVWPWIYLTLGREPFLWVLEFICTQTVASSVLTEDKVSAFSPNVPVALSVPVPARLALIAFWLLCLIQMLWSAPAGTGGFAQRRSPPREEPQRSRQLKQPKQSQSPQKRVVPNTVVRKYYHLLAVLMFVPAIILEVIVNLLDPFHLPNSF